MSAFEFKRIKSETDKTVHHRKKNSSIKQAIKIMKRNRLNHKSSNIMVEKHIGVFDIFACLMIKGLGVISATEGRCF